MQANNSQKRRAGEREQIGHTGSTQSNSIQDERTTNQKRNMDDRSGGKNVKTDQKGKRDNGGNDRQYGHRSQEHRSTARRVRERSTGRREQSARRHTSPDFHQILKTVKGRMDMTFRNLEKGLYQVEKNINEELANVLAQVMDFEEGMKPQLLKPYKKCKEFESLIAPALARTPKRSASEHNGSRRQPADDGNVRGPAKLSPEERYRDLMTHWRDQNGLRMAARSASREERDPCERGRRRGDPPAERRGSRGPPRRPAGCDDVTPENSFTQDDDCITKTMQELQDISVSVNNSLRRINRAFHRTQELREQRPCPVPSAISRPEMLTRVNDSLYQIGTGAKLLKKLLVEERTKAD